MYSDYFGLKTKPFSISPDPDFLFLSPHHQEALAHLIFGMKDQGGFVVLTGEVGTGKTTLIRALLERRDEQIDIALILNPRLSERDFVAVICDELKIIYAADASIKTLIDLLNTYLLNSYAMNRYTVVIVDEAQHLNEELLERVRLLTNLETNKSRLLKVILVGQPELKDTLSRQDLRQVSQRITGRYHLPPLNEVQTQVYIFHRLAIAGCARPLFADNTYRLIYRLTRGIPRLINVLCDRALLGAYSSNSSVVRKQHIYLAADELVLCPAKSYKHLLYLLGGGLLCTLLIALGLWAGTLFLNTSNTTIKEEPSYTENPPSIPPNQTNITAAEPAQINNTPTAQTFRLVGNTLNPFWQALTLWQVPEAPASDQDRCLAIEKQGLACFFGHFTLAELSQINLPVLLQLDVAGQVHEVLWYKLEDDAVVLEDAVGEIRLSHQAFVKALEPYWQGESLIIWRPPFGRTQIGPGESGAAVKILASQLERALGIPLSQLSTYEGKLVDAVKQFQTQMQLTPDGIASTQTLLYLNHWTEVALRPLL